MPEPIHIDDSSQLSDPGQPEPTPTRSGFFKKASTGVSASPRAIPVSDESKLSDPADMGGSVFEGRGAKIKRIATTAAEFGVGPALSFAAGIVAPEYKVAQLGLQAGANVLTNYAQAGIAKLMGEPAGDPSWQDNVRAAAIGMGMTGLGQALGSTIPKGAGMVASEFEGAGPTIRTEPQIKAALLRREVLKQHGMSDQQINEWFTKVERNPALLTDTANITKVAQDAHQQYQTIYNTFKQDFNQKFAAIPHQDARIPTAPIATGINDILSRAPIQARDSSVFKFLQEKQTQLSQGGNETLTFGGQPLTPEQISRLRGMQGFDAQTGPTATLGELRQRITESFENEPRNATEAEKSLMIKYRDQLRQQFDTGMHAAGASGQDIANVKSLYSSYGDYAEALRTLDPRDERMGSKAADILFGGAYKNPDQGLMFAHYVEQADRLHPHQMDQFRQGIISHLLTNAQERGAGRGVMEETRKLAAIQRDIYTASGGTKSGAKFLKAVFGDYSDVTTRTIAGRVGTTTVTIGQPKFGPLTDPAKLSKVIGRLADPAKNVEDMGTIQKVLYSLGPSGATNWIVRYGAITGFGGLLVGSQVGISKLMQHPAALVGSLAMFMVGGKFAQSMLGSHSPAAGLYANALLSGKGEDWAKFINLGGSLAGGTLSGAMNLNLNQPTPPAPQPIVP